MARPLSFALLAALLGAGPAAADVVQYTASPGSYPAVTSQLSGEYGTTAFPPLTETTQSFYTTPAGGPSTLTFRFRHDTGSFQFSFGYYFVTPALQSIDVSTDAGRQAYAQAALAGGNAFEVFNDLIDNPGATATHTVPGGSTLGFFLIPHNTLAAYQAAPGLFTPTTLFPDSQRFPLFSYADTNPGGLDQMMSFFGTSAVTGLPTNLFAFEDLTRIGPTDTAFNDLIFAVDGVQPAAVPEPASLAVFGLAALGGLVAVRRRRAGR
jgi:hypothetical protein